MNTEKSRVVSVFSIRNFKFQGFAFGKGRNGVFIRAHAKSLKKAKAKLKELTSRSQGRNVRIVMQRVKVYIRGWLGYFGIARMKTIMQRWDEWLRRRFRCYIWKQWKLPRTRGENLMKLGMSGGKPTGTETLGRDIGRLQEAVFSHIPLQTKDSQQSDSSASRTTTSLCTYAIEPPCTERYARWCGRSVTQRMGDHTRFLRGFRRQ